MSIDQIISLGRIRLNTWWKDYNRLTHPLKYLFWEATLNCNFNCLHCGSRASRQKKYFDELTTSEIKNVFKSIALQTDPRKVMIAVTGGEPLLRQDLFQVMAYASKLGFPWGLVTNGSLVTTKKVVQMKDSGMKTIVVSIDGIEKTHDVFRQTPRSYEKAINAVKLLTNKKIFENVQITTTVNPDNIQDLEKMHQIFTKLKIDSWRLINADPIGRAQTNKKILLNPTQLKKLLDFIKYKQQTSSIPISYGCTGFLGTKYEGAVRNWYFYCSAGISTASILHNGDIFVCPNVPRIKKLIQGNVRENDFYQTWQKKFKFFRDKNRTSCLKCRKCSFWNDCRGGSLHIWDFEKNQPKFCHLQYLSV